MFLSFVNETGYVDTEVSPYIISPCLALLISCPAMTGLASPRLD